MEGRTDEYYTKLAEFKKNVKARYDNAGQPVQPEPTKEPKAPEPKAPEPKPDVPPTAPAPTPEPKPTPTAEPKLPKELAGASPNYSLAGKPFKLKFKSDVAKAIYIVSGKGKSASHDKYMEWLQAQGFNDATIERLGTQLREHIKGLAGKAEPGELAVNVVPQRKAPAPTEVPQTTRFPQDIYRPAGWRVPDEEAFSMLRKAENTADALRIVREFGQVDAALKRVIDRLLKTGGLDRIKFGITDTKADRAAVGMEGSTRGLHQMWPDGRQLITVRGVVEPGSNATTGMHPWTIVHEALHGAVRRSITLAEHGKGTAKEQKLHTNLLKLRNSIVLESKAKMKDGEWRAKMRAELSEEQFLQLMKGINTIAERSNITAAADELVTWGMTDANVQFAMKYLKGLGEKTSAWTRFVEQVREFLGLAADDASALAELVSYTDELLTTAAKRNDEVGVRYYEDITQEATPEFRTQSDIQGRMKQLDYLLGDFTGIRPEDAILGPYAQRAKSFAQATMLAASGLWQIAETATIAWRFGAAQAGAEFVKQFPGIAGVLRKIGRDPDLYDELGTVLGMDLARDVRVRPWLRQFEPNLAVQGDHTIDRVLHYGQQAVPILNGMKFVHQWQTRVAGNLAMNTLARAANGDAAAIELLAQYGLKGADWDRVKAAVLQNAQMNGKNARSMNWDAWAQADVESAMNTVMRIMDDSVLFGRAGQGSSFSRSGVGQVLGQFRSFVAFAHNKLLRGTIQNQGYTGLAMMLAHQYPLTVIMVAANEFRKGEEVSFDEEGLADLMQKAVGYTAGLGFIGDAAGIVGLSGGRGGISVPITGLANAAPAAAGAIGNALQGEGAAAAGDAVQTARTVLPFVSILPGVAALQNALKE